MIYTTTSVCFALALMLLKPGLQMIVIILLSFPAALAAVPVHNYIEKITRSVLNEKSRQRRLRITSGALSAAAVVGFCILTVEAMVRIEGDLPKSMMMTAIFFVVICFLCGLTGSHGLCRFGICSFFISIATAVVILAVMLIKGIRFNADTIEANFGSGSGVVCALPIVIVFFAVFICLEYGKIKNMKTEIFKIFGSLIYGIALCAMFILSGIDIVFFMSASVLSGSILLGAVFTMLKKTEIKRPKRKTP